MSLCRNPFRPPCCGNPGEMEGLLQRRGIWRDDPELELYERRREGMFEHMPWASGHVDTYSVVIASFDELSCRDPRSPPMASRFAMTMPRKKPKDAVRHPPQRDCVRTQHRNTTAAEGRVVDHRGWSPDLVYAAV